MMVKSVSSATEGASLTSPAYLYDDTARSYFPCKYSIRCLSHHHPPDSPFFWKMHIQYSVVKTPQKLLRELHTSIYPPNIIRRVSEHWNRKGMVNIG